MRNEFIENKEIGKTRLVVAMSGGVDSSTVAALYHQKGYEVIGVTMQLYDQGITLERKGACCAGQDIYDAKMVADRFGFPHYVLNYEDLFKQSVMDDFADSYLRGETPIPCVRCNQSVKFRDLLKMARDLEADALLTGHYVQRKNGANGAELHRAVDDNKDQSYFLFATTKDQLEFTHFPLGGITKAETRKLAHSLGLEIADKADSQDICFVPDGDYARVVERLRPGALDPGEIRHMDGRKLGDHNGIINYTIGQRKGLGLAWPEPLFVIKLDPKDKMVYVGEAHYLGKSELFIRDCNWLIDLNAYSVPIEATVKLRSTHKPIEALVYPENEESVRIELKTPERAITPGQACVIYQDTKVLGGGFIVNTNKS